MDAFTPNIPTEGWDVFRAFVIVGALAFYTLIVLVLFAIADWVGRWMGALVLAALLCFATPSHADDIELCAHHLPHGVPSHPTARTTMVCHPGYAAAHDDDLLIPRWVAYRLTGAQTLGCERRANNFHPERTLPKERRATPADYATSGYDKGHMAPSADFVHSVAQMSDSFSMINVAPQLPGLNRKQWAQLEETARAWAWQRGEVMIYVGPVMPLEPKTIGRRNRVAVPQAFFKVIVDRASNAAIAFAMPQRDIPKGDLEPWQTSIGNIERGAQVALPMPDGIERLRTPELWSADRKGWNAAHRIACRARAANLTAER